MKTRADKKFSYLPLLIASIAVVLFSTAGIARMMGWGPNLAEDFGDIPALEDAATSKGGAGSRCSECGFIVSMREIETRVENSCTGATSAAAPGNGDETRVKSARSYEIIVRMADGSSRSFTAENPASWRTGERLIVIAGADPTELVSLEEVERRYILHVLHAAGGNRTVASGILGLDRKTLYRRLKAYGLGDE